jgi:GAF domain-containing protein
MSRSILNAEGITLFEIILPDDDKLDEPMLRISKATVGDAIGMTFSISEGIAGYVARTGETLNIRDPYNDPRFNSRADQEKGFKTNSLLCVPVFQQQQVVAVIQAVNKRVGTHFTQDDEHMMQVSHERRSRSSAGSAPCRVSAPAEHTWP